MRLEFREALHHSHCSRDLARFNFGREQLQGGGGLLWHHGMACSRHSATLLANLSSCSAVVSREQHLRTETRSRSGRFLGNAAKRGRSIGVNALDR